VRRGESTIDTGGAEGDREQAASEFERWTKPRIDHACAPAYRRYSGELRLLHSAYYHARPEQRSATHPFAAARREFCFLPAHGRLADALTEPDWHRHHLSGASSQTLALALLAPASEADRSFGWLPAGDRIAYPAHSLFEVRLSAEVLNERSRQTTLDWVASGPNGVVVAEAKFTETGFGTCSCDRRAVGECSERVLPRPYWAVAARELYLRRRPGGCSLSLAYQAIRNLAAAQALGRRRGVAAAFVLFHDERNPYFAGAADWPGWVTVLAELASRSSVAFHGLSWQQLMRKAPLPTDVLAWARDKHGLVPSPA